jgi:hypothetical protein
MHAEADAVANTTVGVRLPQQQQQQQQQQHVQDSSAVISGGSTARVG